MADNAYIRRLINNINANNRAINQCSVNRSNAWHRKSQNEARIRELDRVRGNITGGLNGRSDDVANQQNKLGRQLPSAVGKHAHTDEIVYAITREIEKGLSSTSEGMQMISYIDAEKRRCEQEINQANSDAQYYSQRISDLQSYNRSANQAIANERRRIAAQ